MQIDTGNQPIVEARFLLTEITWVPNWNSNDYKTAKGVKIKMAAAKHGTFGKATPSGSIEMLINNPDAYAIFEKAYNESATFSESIPIGTARLLTKRYKVYFVEDENQEPDK